jgi:hypothetical protein
MAPSSQELEPPANPARFSIAEIIRNEQATGFINRQSYRPASRFVV